MKKNNNAIIKENGGVNKCKQLRAPFLSLDAKE